MSFVSVLQPLGVAVGRCRVASGSEFLAHRAAIATEDFWGAAGQEPRSRISFRNKSSTDCEDWFSWVKNLQIPLQTSLFLF